jgi:hypothetical protein
MRANGASQNSNGVMSVDPFQSGIKRRAEYDIDNHEFDKIGTGKYPNFKFGMFCRCKLPHALLLAFVINPFLTYKNGLTLRTGLLNAIRKIADYGSLFSENAFRTRSCWAI